MEEWDDEGIDRTLDFGEVKLILKEFPEIGIGGTIWEGGLLMCKYIEHLVSKKAEYFKGKKILELGSGTGICGIMLSKLGSIVTLTDLPECMDKIRANAIVNKVENNISIRSFPWGEDIKELNAPFDIIVGADVIYQDEHIDSLIKTLKETSDSTSEIWISCSKRKGGQTFFTKVKEFFQVMQIENDKFIGGDLPSDCKLLVIKKK